MISFEVEKLDIGYKICVYTEDSDSEMYVEPKKAAVDSPEKIMRMLKMWLSDHKNFDFDSEMKNDLSDTEKM